MKRKYYLRGLGIGIIFTSIVLILTFSITPNSKMTNEEIIRVAKSLGMVEQEDNLSQILQNEKENNTTEEIISTEESPELTTEKVIQEATTENISTEIKSEVTTEEIITTEEFTETIDEQYVTIVVEKGMNSSQVSNLLFSSGLIDSAEEFNQYLTEEGYATRVRIGTYDIRIGASFNEILKIITKQKI